VNLQVGSYAWLTYQEVYDTALKMGSAMRSRGVNPVSLQHFLLFQDNCIGITE